MLIEDESGASQIFARQRLTFQCDTGPVSRDTTEWQATMERYRVRFGQMVNLLKSLPDFQLFKLAPKSGRLVLGFGQAYTLGGDRLDTLTYQRGR